jgi:hypothetical protein
MTRDDLMPMRRFMAPPATLDEAIERVAEACEVTMIGLVGCMFLDVGQLQKALKECKLKAEGKSKPYPHNGEFQLICDSGPVKTWRGFFFDPGGNSFEIIANSWSDHLCQVVNVRFSAAALDTDQEAVKNIHKTMRGE